MSVKLISSRCLITAACCVVLATNSGAWAADPEPTLTATFDGPERPRKWGINFGHWEPKDGVLVCRQLERDNHAAASWWQVPMSDGIVTLRLKLNDAKAFHLGFDPAPGELDKKGHLYSLIITPENTSLKKHKDKADPASKDQVLATASPTPNSDWIDIRLETRGDNVTCRVGDGLMLKASDPTFHVKKPTVVFRVIGGEAHLDNVSVTVLAE